MKYYFYVVFSAIAISSCVSQSKSNEKKIPTQLLIASEIEKIGNAENCRLVYTDDINISKKEARLIVACSCEPTNDFFYGKIIMNINQSLKKLKANRDFIKLKSNTGEVVYELSANVLENYSKIENHFQSDFEVLKTANKENFEKLIHDSVLKETSSSDTYNQMFESFSKDQGNWIFGGFGILQKNGENYIVFANELKGEVFVYLSYKLTENQEKLSDSKIYGVGVVPQ